VKYSKVFHDNLRSLNYFQNFHKFAHLLSHSSVMIGRVCVLGVCVLGCMCSGRMRFGLCVLSVCVLGWTLDPKLHQRKRMSQSDKICAFVIMP
jgi:hypothetical protein